MAHWMVLRYKAMRGEQKKMREIWTEPWTRCKFWPHCLMTEVALLHHYIGAGILRFYSFVNSFISLSHSLSYLHRPLSLHLPSHLHLPRHLRLPSHPRLLFSQSYWPKLLSEERTRFLLLEYNNRFQTRHQYLAATQFSHNTLLKQWCFKSSPVTETNGKNRLSIINHKTRQSLAIYLDCWQRISNSVDELSTWLPSFPDFFIHLWHNAFIYDTIIDFKWQ